MKVLELDGTERKEMSVSELFRRRAAADTAEQAAVSGDSRMDAWARVRGAALVESVVRATRRDG
jgi:hypothetical protein